MLDKSQMHSYQTEAVAYIKRMKRCGLFLEMGLGKTVITLTAIEELIFTDFEVRKVLVIAPKQVALHTWADEVGEWNHLQKLRVAVAVGTKKQRMDALQSEAEVYTINRENVQWLLNDSGLPFDYDMVVVDELSSFKSPKAKRWKALRKKFGCYSYFVGLTGTPSPNGYMDLWSQCALIDNGVALEKTMTQYRMKYFVPLYGQGHIVYKWGYRDGARKAIEERVSTIAMSMQAKDYLTLPAVNYVDVPIYLTDAEMKLYKRFERDRVLELTDGGAILATNAAVLCGKLLQFCSGAVYFEEDDTLDATSTEEPVCVKLDGKNEASEDIDELEKFGERSDGVAYVKSGITSKYERFIDFLDETSENVLILYSFRHEYNRLKQIAGAESLHTDGVFEKWNKGEVSRLLGHPKSMGHGLNMQSGGRIVAWYGLTWSLEEWQQANARLYRQGQKKPVFVYRFYCVSTIEERIIKSLADKKSTQQALMDAVKSTCESVVLSR